MIRGGGGRDVFDEIKDCLLADIVLTSHTTQQGVKEDEELKEDEEEGVVGRVRHDDMVQT